MLSRSRVSGGEGYPSESRVKRGSRVVHGEKELVEKLGRNDLCPCGSGRRFQKLLHALWPFRRQRTESLRSRLISANRKGGPWPPFPGNEKSYAHEHPVVLPHVSHFKHVPLRTSVKLPHSPHASPS